MWLFARVRSPMVPLLNPQTRRHIDLIRFMKSAGNVYRHARILDVGCGPGWLAQRLFESGFIRVSGTDWLPPEQVDTTVMQGYHRADLNERGLADFNAGQFDCTICSDVLEHLERPALMLRELARVTAPGGAIYVTLPNAFNIVQRVSFLLTGNSKRYRTEKPGGYGHISLLPSDVLQSLLSRARLRILREGRGFAALGGFLILPSLNFGPWASYCRYYCLTHQ